MARKKAKAAEDPWAYYRSIQLTPEQRTANREELERQAGEGPELYEQFLALVGNVNFDIDLDELRRDRD